MAETKTYCIKRDHSYQITKQKDREGTPIWKCAHCGKKVSST